MHFCNCWKQTKMHSTDLLVQNNDGIIPFFYAHLILPQTTFLLQPNNIWTGDDTFQHSVILWIAFSFAFPLQKIITFKKKTKWIISFLSSVFAFCFLWLFNYLLPMLTPLCMTGVSTIEPADGNSAEGVHAFSEGAGANSFWYQLPVLPYFAYEAEWASREALSATRSQNYSIYTDVDLELCLFSPLSLSFSFLQPSPPYLSPTPHFFLVILFFTDCSFHHSAQQYCSLHFRDHVTALQQYIWQDSPKLCC